MIRDEINEENFYSLYAQAYSLGCERLLEDLRELSITSLLNEHTVLHLYLDAVEHHEVKIMEACSYVIIERFEEICNRQDDKQLSDLMELDLENFIDILKSDGLNLVNEDILIEIVRSYISIREKVVPKLADTAEARTPPALWALLTSDEKNNRIASFDAEKKTKDVALTEAMDQEAAVYFSKDLPDRV